MSEKNDKEISKDLNLNPFDVNLGKNIRKRRKSLSITLDTLAETLGLTPGYVGLIERGRRGLRAHCLPKLSEALKISVDELFLESE